MSALLNSIEHALSSAANDVVKVGKFVVGNPGQDERDSGMIPNGVPG